MDQRPTRRVYTVTTPEFVPAPSVVRGIFLFCNSIANVLIYMIFLLLIPINVYKCVWIVLLHFSFVKP